MNILTVTLFCIVSCVLLKLLSSGSGEIKLICGLMAACIVTARFLGEFFEISSVISDLFDQTGLDYEYLQIIFKSLGVCYVTQLGCDYCRDCSESALASQLELAGKAAIIVISLPLFRTAVEIAAELLI